MIVFPANISLSIRDLPKTSPWIYLLFSPTIGQKKMTYVQTDGGSTFK